MVDYFKFFDLPERFETDQTELRSRYLANSRKFHPDLYDGDEDPEELSSINNEGYRILKDYFETVAYVLRNRQVLVEGEKEQLDPMFLGEMMDINEGLMELEFDFDPEVFQRLKEESEEKQQEIEDGLRLLTQRFENEQDETLLGQIKEYYLKRKYLLRIRDSINKFAPA